MTIKRSPLPALPLAALLAVPLAACSPATPEQMRASDMVRCNEHFAVMADTPKQADALCNCMIDTLAERDMTMGNMFGSGAEEVKTVSALCAREVGIPPEL